IAGGIRAAFISRKLVPVLCLSAARNIGIQPLLDFIAAAFPSPADTGAVTGATPAGGEVHVRPSQEGPLVAQVFKTMADPYVGRLSVFRVFSGILRSDSATYNVSKAKNERIGQLYLLRGKSQEPVEAVAAGDIGAVAKLQETTTNDTLGAKEQPVILPKIEFPEPVISLAAEPKSKGDEDKIGSGLARLSEEDPTFRFERNTETKQLLASGLGDLHLEVITSRLAKKFGVEVNLSTPKIPYRETIRGSTKVEGKFKRQTGGRGQYGHVWLEMEPLETGGFEFQDKLFGGSVPRQYVPAVEKGCRETMEEGVLAGYPVVDIRVSIVDGSYHAVDSSEMAFKIATSMAFKKGFAEARPVLLEPIMNVEVTVPDEYMGDVIGDLNKKRGKIQGMEPTGALQVVKATAPLAEMHRYATDLRSMTQGRGLFRMRFAHYEEVPAHQAQVIIENAKKDGDAAR
ncbi:MAG: elongation factor G, partial [Firmicutes bacterium]|nr:elongation factor G [Bacillota bacterium]